jgi:hypothetical protein
LCLNLLSASCLGPVGLTWQPGCSASPRLLLGPNTQSSVLTGGLLHPAIQVFMSISETISRGYPTSQEPGMVPSVSPTTHLEVLLLWALLLPPSKPVFIKLGKGPGTHRWKEAAKANPTVLPQTGEQRPTDTICVFMNVCQECRHHTLSPNIPGPMSHLLVWQACLLVWYKLFSCLEHRLL